MDNTREKLIEVQKLSGIGEKFEKQIAIQKQFAEKMKLIELLNDAYFDYRHGKGDSDMLTNFADHLIANGVTVQKWISVTERLPELWQDCFVLVKMKYDWEKDYEYNVDAGCYVGENGYIECFNTYNDWNEGQEYIHITHWMPLPQAPKEG